jgi:hypothetical protein
MSTITAIPDRNPQAATQPPVRPEYERALEPLGTVAPTQPCPGLPGCGDWPPCAGG